MFATALNCMQSVSQSVYIAQYTKGRWISQRSTLECGLMNLTRAIRYLLLLLFALLQCVAPLAHAHVNGNNAAQNVHLAIIDSAALAVHDSDATHFAAERHPSAVVCMPPEYRCGDLAAAQPVHAHKQCPSVLCEHIALRFVNLYQQSLPLPPYQHPRSQAPPA